MQVLQLLNTLGNNIGIGITNIVNTFNPEMVIIGNRISQFERWIINPIKHTLDKRLSAYHKTNTDICFSILGNDSTALGANSFAINNFFAKMKIAETKLVQKQY